MSTESGMTDINVNDRIEKCSIWFKRFSEQAKDSKIYNYLSSKISTDRDILEIVSQANFSQPVPNLFYASINFLLIKDSGTLLRSYYPSFGGERPVDDNFFIEFKKYAIKNKNIIIDLCNSRLVQTNEVRRSTLFAKGFSIACSSLKINDVGLIDLGCSGGLNLLFDKYHNKYSDGTSLGDTNSKLTLNCEITNNDESLDFLPNVHKRIGFDLNPLNLINEDDENWAFSLIWPDQLQRIENFKNAVDLRKDNEIELFKGSTFSDIESSLVNLLSNDVTPCFMHSFTFNQLSKDERLVFTNGLKKVSKKGRVLEFSIEWLSTETPEFDCEVYEGGEKIKTINIAKCDQHGQWIELK